MDAKHTPWSVLKYDCVIHPGCDGHADIIDGSGATVTASAPISPDHAALIVRAVNAHDDLVELAEGVITLVETRFPSQAEFFKGLGMVEKAARAALAKAKG